MREYSGFGNAIRKFYGEHPNALDKTAAELSKPSQVIPITTDLYPGSVLKSMKFPSRLEIVEGLISQGDVVLLLGKPKTGKSRFCEQLTVSCATGRSFLGMKITEKQKVLYLDLENTPSRIQARFNRLGGSEDWSVNTHFYAPSTLAENGVDLSRPGGLKNLKAMIDQVSPDLLICDTWRLLLGVDESKVDHVIRALALLSSLKKGAPSLSIILVHHVRKQVANLTPKLKIDPALWIESCSGHYALVGHVDSAFGIERDRDVDGSEQIVFGGVSRNFKPPLLLLEDCTDLSFRRLAGEEAAVALMSSKEREIWSKAKELQRFTFEQLKGIIDVQASVIWTCLRKAQDFDLLDRVERSYFTKVKGGLPDESWYDK